jgi:predicted RNase H-like HicB family nuclease
MINADTLDFQLARSWTRELTPDGDVVSARVVELDGCFSEGPTMEIALANLQDALELWLEAAMESGSPIPEPRAEFESSEYSGRFTVRVARSLHRELSEAARLEGLSLNQFVSGLLAHSGPSSRELTTAASSIPDIREDIAADAIAESVNSIGARKGIAGHLRNLGATNLACLVYAFAAELVARNAGAQQAANEYGKAAALARNNSSNALAESLWNESLRLDATNARSASRLGQLLHHQGRYPEAIELLERVSEDNYATNFLGFSQIQLGLQRHDDDLVEAGLSNAETALRRWAYQGSARERPAWLRQIAHLSRLGPRSTSVVDRLIKYANGNSNWGSIDTADVTSSDTDEESGSDAVSGVDRDVRDA